MNIAGRAPVLRELALEGGEINNEYVHVLFQMSAVRKTKQNAGERVSDCGVGEGLPRQTW